MCILASLESKKQNYVLVFSWRKVESCMLCVSIIVLAILIPSTFAPASCILIRKSNACSKGQMMRTHDTAYHGIHWSVKQLPVSKVCLANKQRPQCQPWLTAISQTKRSQTGLQSSIVYQLDCRLQTEVKQIASLNSTQSCTEHSPTKGKTSMVLPVGNKSIDSPFGVFPGTWGLWRTPFFSCCKTRMAALHKHHANGKALLDCRDSSM